MRWADTPPELYERLESFGLEMLALRGFSALVTDWDFTPEDRDDSKGAK